jgi:hypothetical protein
VIRVLFALVLIAVGTASYAVAHRFAQPPPTERIVYCPIGNMGPECVNARRLYDTGKIPVASRAP